MMIEKKHWIFILFLTIFLGISGCTPTSSDTGFFRRLEISGNVKDSNLPKDNTTYYSGVHLYKNHYFTTNGTLYYRKTNETNWKAVLSSSIDPPQKRASSLYSTSDFLYVSIIEESSSFESHLASISYSAGSPSLNYLTNTPLEGQILLILLATEGVIYYLKSVNSQDQPSYGIFSWSLGEEEEILTTNRIRKSLVIDQNRLFLLADSTIYILDTRNQDAPATELTFTLENSTPPRNYIDAVGFTTGDTREIILIANNCNNFDTCTDDTQFLKFEFETDAIQNNGQAVVINLGAADERFVALEHFIYSNNSQYLLAIKKSARTEDSLATFFPFTNTFESLDNLFSDEEDRPFKFRSAPITSVKALNAPDLVFFLVTRNSGLWKFEIETLTDNSVSLQLEVE